MQIRTRAPTEMKIWAPFDLDNWLNLRRTRCLRVQLIRLYIFEDVLSSEEPNRAVQSRQTTVSVINGRGWEAFVCRHAENVCSSLRIRGQGLQALGG